MCECVCVCGGRGEGAYMCVSVCAFVCLLVCVRACVCVNVLRLCTDSQESTHAVRKNTTTPSLHSNSELLRRCKRHIRTNATKPGWHNTKTG